MEKIIELKALFKEYFGNECTHALKLKQSGSNREYYRLSNARNQKAIGTWGENINENYAFINLAKHFYKAGLNVPEIYITNNNCQFYLQQDLGDISLFNLIKGSAKTQSYDDLQIDLLENTIKSLASFQFIGARKLDYNLCFPVSCFDRRSISWDLNYFKYCFLKLSGVDFSEVELENEFDKLTHHLLLFPSNTFMYRDFQSRNVMIYNDSPYFIDFQGGRQGPFYYDVASFLWQARANFPTSLKEHLIDVYVKELNKYIKITRSEFRNNLNFFILFRGLQVLGAYGFRGLYEKKQNFIDSIAPALSNLRELLPSFKDDFNYLRTLIDKLSIAYDTSKLQEILNNNLVVKITSFSYKRGIPEDDSGNGGGFVFDCRAIHNPGKYERYKTLTGRDKEVKEFLENEVEMRNFLENVKNLSEASVKKYLDRGFTNLMISFGCTGGQHRSVFSAESLAKYLHNKLGIKVILVHRELGLNEILEAK